MEIEDLLHESEAAIVTDACRVVGQLEHYRRDGVKETLRRVEALYRHIIAAVRVRDLTDLRAHLAAIARDRLAAGYDVQELMAAFSAIEKAIWHHALIRLPAYDQAWGIGLACTVLAHGKAELGQAVRAMAPSVPLPPIDLTQLFSGTGPVHPCPPEEKVYPV